MLEAYEWIFDLDDTLYAERDYVISAFSFAGNLIDDLFGCKGSFDYLKLLFDAGDTNPIDKLWRRENLPEPAKDGLIAAMRTHKPKIKLRPGAESLLEDLRIRGAGFSIMTDGRSLTQRTKLAALGCLDARAILISQESGWQKPDPRCYQFFNTLFSGRKFVYIGDNPSKDFVMAKKCGWLTIMLADDGKHIHGQDPIASIEYSADYIVRDLAEVIKKINFDF